MTALFGLYVLFSLWWMHSLEKEINTVNEYVLDLEEELYDTNVLKDQSEEPELLLENEA